MCDADRRSQDRVTVSHDVGQNHRFRLPPEGQFHAAWCSIHFDSQPSTLGAADIAAYFFLPINPRFLIILPLNYPIFAASPSRIDLGCTSPIPFLSSASRGRRASRPSHLRAPCPTQSRWWCRPIGRLCPWPESPGFPAPCGTGRTPLARG